MRWAGRALAVLALLFVFHRMATTPWLVALSKQPSLWLWAALAALLLALANGVLGVAWWTLLRLVGEPIIFRRALVVHGRTQIAKYLPGGVLHYAGRHLMLPEARQRNVLLASGLEAGALVALAAMVAWWLLQPEFAQERGLFVVASAALVTAAFGFARRSAAEALLALAAIALYGAYLMLFGIALVWLCLPLAATPLTPPAAVTLLGVATAAWLAGFLAFGAPAGLGVREATLLAFLPPLLPNEAALVAVLLLRVAAMLADIAVWAIAALVPPARLA
jgi:uncharacterized membrane protein YbhN (UPF0104 family)